tara:strand:- start:394 stop:525 length:132 start_codon:yes stop_codon:yes gene_type:complete
MEELNIAYTEYNTIPIIVFGILAYVTKVLVKDIKNEDNTKYKE